MKNAAVKRIVIYRECPICYRDTEVRINCSDNEYIDYQINYKGLIKPYKPIQDIFPNISKQQRETIKSGICRRCQKEIF